MKEVAILPDDLIENVNAFIESLRCKSPEELEEAASEAERRAEEFYRTVAGQAAQRDMDEGFDEWAVEHAGPLPPLLPKLDTGRGPRFADFQEPDSGAPAVEWAIAYAGVGMRVFPCNARKQPFTPHGLKDATTNGLIIRSWWAKWPAADPGWAVPGDVVVVDLDMKGRARGISEFAEHDGINPDDVVTPSTTSPTGGRHLFFAAGGRRFSNAVRIVGSTGIDLRSAGGYVVLPAAGNGRRWLNPLDTPLAPAPAWLPDKAPEADQSPAGEARPYTGEATPYALAALSSACERILAAEDGKQRFTLNAEALSIGGLVKGGELDRQGAFETLVAAGIGMQNFDKSKPWTIDDVEKTVKIAFRDAKPRNTPSNEIEENEREAAAGMAAGGAKAEESVGDDGPAAEQPGGAAPEEPAAAEPAGDQDPFASISLGRGVDWTQPGQGLLEDIATWIMANARWPNRALSVAAAVATASALAGRWLYGPTDASLGVYIVGLADTGVGKDDPLSAPGQVLRAVHPDVGRLQTSGKVFSVSGLERIMRDNPCSLATVDEIGTALFARISHKNASSDVQTIKSALQELWSRKRGKGPYSSTHRADFARRRDPLAEPHPVRRLDAGPVLRGAQERRPGERLHQPVPDGARPGRERSAKHKTL